ncbi:hypothetical protein L6R52_33285 [Myxococcota bacterium]|nr:hypothetical protein [Myxococcota bacterium]
MMTRTIARLLPTALCAVTVTACGSSGPDLDQVRKDFANPTGSISDRTALMDATGKREASGPALALAGGGIPGQSLTAADARGLGQLAPMQLHGRHMERVRYALSKTGRSLSGLAAADAELPGDGDYSNTCAESPEATAAFEQAYEALIRDAAGGGSSASASASYSIDVSSCAANMTGTLSIDLEISVEASSANSGSMRFKVTQKYEDVCEVGGESRCIDGTFVMEASASSDGMTTGAFETISAWELTASWVDAGTTHTASTKGGIRMSFEGEGEQGSFSIEYLVYAENAQGEEVSFVLEISADSEGQAALVYRGADGSLECHVEESGAGTCTAVGSNGTETVTWTAEEYAAEQQDG